MTAVAVSEPVSQTSPELDLAALDVAAEFLRGRRFVALTGAGISTDSGIPDYRGEGAP
ncbi:MAG TPA: NAD-dependent deacetylase, partial [Microbacteriaceae bacterium]|nr:NAD-dependent deacetylase [Microbacteriaceae bacterium]